MSELQVSLIAIGIVVVMGVVFFNWLQQRRYRRQAEQAFGQKHEDVLLRSATSPDEGRIEPRFGMREIPGEAEAEPKLNEAVETAGAPPETSEPLPPSDVIPAPPHASIPESTPGSMPDSVPDSVQGTKPDSTSASVSIVAPGQATRQDEKRRRSVPVFDGKVDYVASISSEKKIESSSFSLLLQRKFDFSKPVRWFGSRGAEGPWEEIAAEADGKPGYFNLRGRLQLADRAGPISEVHLSEFRDVVENFAAGIGASASCPDIGRAYAQALALDEFCGEVDVMIGINIISRDGSRLTGAKIRTVAEALGLKLAADGLFSLRDESNVMLFSLANLEPQPFPADMWRTFTTQGVTFLLDVPRVPNGDMVFEQMVRVAEGFADSVGGILVDDRRAPLSAGGIDKIKQQLLVIESMMAARNIPAGSEVALRLFA